MKRSLVILALATVSAAAAAAAVRGPGLIQLPRASKAGENTMFGHIKALKRTGARYELRFDPAWWLTGLAAKRAHLEDTGSSEVPNDYYIVDEGHRLLTFAVAANTHVTVLTAGTRTTAISVARLAQLVRAGKERYPGFWVRISAKYPNGLASIDQQFQP
jgi:hypothetical protein